MAIITISRGTMSGGRAVAQCLADRLGYPCLGREVLQTAARTLGASEETVRHKLQTPPGLWDQVTRERQAYVVAVQAALAAHCTTGSLVYHGLAGQLLLRDVPGVLRVRLIAPVAMRVQAILAQHSRTNHVAAERFIQSVDRQRRRWVRRMYGVEINDTSLYELTINLESITLATACVMIAELARQPHYEVTADTRQRIQAFAADCDRRVAEVIGPRAGQRPASGEGA
jgi:cytidylate kinase